MESGALLLFGYTACLLTKGCHLLPGVFAIAEDALWGRH